MDIAFSKFRDKKESSLYDNRIIIINSRITDRTELAHTIRFLNNQNVKVIGVDLLLDSLYGTPGDTLLRDAIQKCDRIVLGYTFLEGTVHEQSRFGLQPDSFFCYNTKMAFVNLGSNDGLSVRTFEPYHLISGQTGEAFAVKIAGLYDSSISDELRKRDHTKEWINFRRVQPGAQNMFYPVNSSQVIHYTQLEINNFLHDTSQFERDYFKDKIVLIGFCGENEQAVSMKDRYYTPLNEQYTGRSLPDMHGVVVHANIISMLLDRDFIYDVSNTGIYLVSFLLFVLNYMLFAKIHHMDFFRSLPYIRIIQVIQFFLILGICLALLLSANVKLGFTFLATCVILSYELYEAYDQKLKVKIQSKASKFYNWRPGRS